MMKEIASAFPHRRGFHCCGLYTEAMMNAYEQTIRQILQRAEALYEQFGNPLVSARRHRRARAFARAFGATRLAHEFRVPRATIVSARRLAFARWRYWMERYEEPRWQEIASVAGAHTQWEGVVVRYLRVRAVLRQGQLPSDASADAPISDQHADRVCAPLVGQRVLALTYNGVLAERLATARAAPRATGTIVSRSTQLEWCPVASYHACGFLRGCSHLAAAEPTTIPGAQYLATNASRRVASDRPGVVSDPEYQPVAVGSLLTGRHHTHRTAS